MIHDIEIYLQEREDSVNILILDTRSDVNHMTP